MARLSPAQRQQVAAQLAAARAHLAAGDPEGALREALEAHALAMNHPLDHARCHCRMLRAEWRRRRLGACRRQLTQTLLAPAASAARLIRGLEPGEPGGSSILGTLFL